MNKIEVRNWLCQFPFDSFFFWKIYEIAFLSASLYNEKVVDREIYFKYEEIVVAGIDVTINSDDFLIFDDDVSKEYLRLYQDEKRELWVTNLWN